MKRLKPILFLALGIFAIELAIFLYSTSLSLEESRVYQFAARYSARFSFIIFIILFAWVGSIGLNKVYEDERKRSVFVLGTLAFAINHMIHFGLLVRTHQLLDWELFVLQSTGGALGYLALVLLPVILWKKKVLTKGLYWGILSCFAYLEIIFFLSYFGRWTIENIYNPDSKLFFVICSVVVVILFVLNSFRVIQEERK
ncbi:MAG: GlyGly-CTERM sorting domain-containing protein [Reichenbachiella sp.]